MSLRKNLGMTLITQILSWALTLAVSLKLPGYLGDKNLGRFELAGAIAGAFSVLVMLGTSRVLTKEIARDRNKFGPLLATAIKLRFFLAIPAVLLGLLLTIVLRYDTITQLLVSIALGVMILTCINDAVSSARAGQEDFKRINLAQLVEKITTGIILLSLALLKAPLWLFFVGMLIPTLLSLLILSRGQKIESQPGNLSALAREGMPYLSNAIFIKLYGTSAPLLLSTLGSLEAVGWFALAKRLGGSTLFVPTALCGVLLPRLSAHWQDDKLAYARDVKRMFLLLIVCVVPLAGVLIIFPVQILQILHYPQSFSRAIPVISLMGISIGLWFLTQAAATALIAADKQTVFAKLTGIAAALCFPLGAVCILWTKAALGNPAIGAIGADALIEAGLLAGYLKNLDWGVENA
jgi:O-antigen/teichoic acid export membrane protein